MNDSVISHAIKGLIKFVSVTQLNVDEIYSRLGKVETFAEEVLEELSLQEHRIGSIETKLDGEIVSIKDLASRLNRLEEAPYWHPDAITVEGEITDAIHKLYEMHGMEIDFSIEPKGGDDE